MHALRAAVVVLALSGASASAQPVTPAASRSGATPSRPVATENDSKAWSFSASAYGYVLPDEPNFVQPTFAADRGWLHLEARYNYESLRTGSVWVGYNFSGGSAIAWELTPMLGGVFGGTDGVAPGYKGSLGWWKLEFSSEGEYLFDAAASTDSFFYNWSELAIAPLDWFRAGLVGQRTRAYQAPREIQRGLLVGVSFRSVEVTTYVFNPDDSKPSVVVAAVVNF